MMKPTGDTLEVPFQHLSTASKEEIMYYFEQQKYTDPLGHKLTHNIDFIQLVESATEQFNDVRH